MYQINKRFFIGIGIIEALCLLFWILGAVGFPIWAAASITLVLNFLYFIFFFVGLKIINEDEAELQKQVDAQDPNLVIKISNNDAKKFKKEGALMINGNEYINKDYELWKINQNKTIK